MGVEVILIAKGLGDQEFWGSVFAGMGRKNLG
jgi:hypothetical protein